MDHKLALSPWFRTTPKWDRLNIICFPFAGSDASFYLRWRKELAYDLEIHPVYLPGRGLRSGEKLSTSFTDTTEMLLPSLHKFAGAPYALLGTSMGAWLAFEAALQIQRIGIPAPKALIVCSAGSPSFRTNIPDLEGITDAEARSRLALMNRGAVDALHNEELFQLFLPVICADLKACRQWIVKKNARINTPILSFRGTLDDISSEIGARDWAQFTTQTFHHTELQGDHFFVTQRNLEFFDKLRAILK